LWYEKIILHGREKYHDGGDDDSGEDHDDDGTGSGVVTGRGSNDHDNDDSGTVNGGEGDNSEHKNSDEFREDIDFVTNKEVALQMIEVMSNNKTCPSNHIHNVAIKHSSSSRKKHVLTTPIVG
jgi:hypothetical protein